MNAFSDFISDVQSFKSVDIHTKSSFFGFPSVGGVTGAPGAVAGQAGAAPGAPGTSGGPFGGAADQGIDVKAEISRIENNIFMYHIAIALGALGIGVTTCLFVRSILKPPKGFHSGSSDGDMDDSEEESETSE